MRNPASLPNPTFQQSQISQKKRIPAMTATIDPLLTLPVRSPRRAPVVRQAQAPVRARVASRPSEAVYRRRRRTVGLVLALLMALAAFLLIGPGAVASESTPALQQAPRTVIAQRGDTIWDIARTLVPTGPIGDLVTELIRLNGTRIEPGQVIRLP